MSESDKIIVKVDFSKLPNSEKALSDVYNIIAASAGVNPDDVKNYDCRLIDYSRNGQDFIYEKVGTHINDAAQITMALAMSGMKVDDNLPPNTAVIYRNGIVLKDGKDLLDVKGASAGISLFLSSDCIESSTEKNYYKRILVLKPNKLKAEFQDSKYQLWMPYADTFGCNPARIGKAVYAVCLYDGEISTVNWRRDDFLGVLKPDRVPPFVSEKGYYDMFMADDKFKDSIDDALSNQSQELATGGQSHER